MYFPKSQIETNLYTNGGEFVYRSNKKQYTGYYWRTFRGQFFSGKTPQDTPIEELILNSDGPLATQEIGAAVFVQKVDFIPIVDDNYTLDSKEVYIPSYFPNIPIGQDYKIGEYKRYFCKKTNEIIYLEISVTDYNKLISKDSSILYQMYIPFNIPWKLIGNKNEVYKINKNIVEYTTIKKKFPMFNKYLQEDYTKYYKEKP